MRQFLSKLLVRKHELLSFLIPLVVYAFTLREVKFDPDLLNVFTQYALWTSGNPSLGSVSDPASQHLVYYIDYVISNGQYYSAYAPGLPYLSLPFGALAFLLSHGNEINRAILADEAFVAICAALASLVLYRICRMYARPIPSLLTSLTLAFATIVWPFATVLFNHDVTMLFSLLGVYCVLQFSKIETHRRTKLILIATAGASLGIASTLEYLSVLLIIPLVLFLASKRKLGVFYGSLFVGIFSLGPFLDLTYNQLVTGNLLIFPEAVCACAHGQTILSRFDLSQLFTVPIYNLLSPYRGLFLISPVILVGIYGLFRMYRSGKFRADALLFVSIFLLGIFPYSAWSDWQGGGSFGPRLLIDVIPYLVIPIAYVLSENGHGFTRTRIAFLSLFLTSSFMSGAAAFTSPDPISPTTPSLFFFQPIGQSIPWLLQNNLDVWWFRYFPYLAVIIVPLCFLLIWSITTRLLSSKRDSTARVP